MYVIHEKLEIWIASKLDHMSCPLQVVNARQLTIKSVIIMAE